MSVLKGLASPAYCLGDPHSLQASAEALKRTATELQELRADLERRIAEAVPGGWDGAGAQAFQRLAGQQMDYVLQLQHAADSLLNADNVLVRGLSEAQAQYRQAQAAAERANLDIDERLVVWPREVTDQGIAAAVEVQKQVDAAVRTASDARAVATDVFEQNHRFLCDLRQAALEALVLALLRGKGGRRTAPVAASKPPAVAAPAGSAVKWPRREDFKTEREYGTAFHNAMKNLVRPMEGKALPAGWRTVKVERTVGGTKRVDVMHVNDDQKIIVVEDYVTGRTESVAHATKGWQYANEPEILALRKQGYDYQYAPAMAHPDYLQ